MPNNFYKKNSVFIIIAIIILSLPVSVYSANPFNVEIELSDNYRNVNPGSEVWFTMFLLNLDNTQRLDVTLNYEVINSSNNKSIVHASKTVAVETQASFVASLNIPEDTPPGDYLLVVSVSSSLGESSAKTSLKVFVPENDLKIYYYAAGGVVLLLIIALLSKSGPLIKRIRLKMRIHKIVREKLKNK
ncbi:MAG TPA: hypothetical protein VEC16_00015 [Alphaproteobacteria bacterium]|nr:hypothetical protein [Alphaproteobacteria bacterium]